MVISSEEEAALGAACFIFGSPEAAGMWNILQIGEFEMKVGCVKV